MTCAIAAAVLVAAGCAADVRRQEQSEILRDTCVSLTERSAPRVWSLAADVAASDAGRFAVDGGRTTTQRAVDLLIRYCLAPPP